MYTCIQLSTTLENENTAHVTIPVKKSQRIDILEHFNNLLLQALMLKQHCDLETHLTHV